MSDSRPQFLNALEDLIQSQKEIIENFEDRITDFYHLMDFNVLRIGVHRAKGLTGFSPDESTANWLSDLEALLTQMTLMRHPHNDKDSVFDIFQKLDTNLNGLKEMVENQETIKIEPVAILANSLYMTVMGNAITTPEKKIICEKLSWIPWANDLTTRLSTTYTNFLQVALEENRLISGCHFKIPIDQISKVQKLDIQKESIFLLDLWPLVQEDGVDIRSLFIYRDQSFFDELESLIPVTADWVHK